jgi:hypothetical protein
MKRILTNLACLLLAMAVVNVPALAQQSASILGHTDLTGLLGSVPAMPGSTQDATRDRETEYGTFSKRAEAAHQAIKAAAAERFKPTMQQDPAAVERQARAQVNSNPIVSGAGGVDKLQHMTPAQREAAVRQSMAGFQQNLVTGNGRNSPEMRAMMQKVMSDPAYRARLNSMTPQEQEAEIRRNMGKVTPLSAEEHEKAQQQLRNGDEIRTSMAVRNEINEMGTRLGEIEATYARRDQAISLTPGNHRQIAEAIGDKMAKVPIVELGEYGHDRDPVKVQALEREKARMDRDRAAAELAERTKLYKQRKLEYAGLIANYQTWLKQNLGRINTSTNFMENKNTELAVAGYEEALIGISEDLAKYSKDATRDAAMYENIYKDKM